jgi:hypothetical protein
MLSGIEYVKGLGHEFSLDQKNKEIKKFSKNNFSSIAFFNLAYNVDLEKNNNEKGFSEVSVLFINTINECEDEDFNKSDNQEILNQEEMTDFGSILADKLSKKEIYFEYIADQKKYDDLKYEGYNYCKQVGTFVQRYGKKDDVSETIQGIGSDHELPRDKKNNEKNSKKLKYNYFSKKNIPFSFFVLSFMSLIFFLKK